MEQLAKNYEHRFSFTQQQVDQFAEISGDKNPIHLDESYAAKSIFKRRILHGFLVGSVFSKVFGTIYPGEGTIYLKQDMRFLAPMYTNINYTAHFHILEVFNDKRRARVKTVVKDEKDKDMIVGEAVIQHKTFEKYSL